MTTERQSRLTRTMEAVRDGRAFLNTYVGQRKIESYDDRAGSAVTGHGNDRGIWTVTLERIVIA